MRWFRFAVLILVVTVLQKGLLARLHTKPDLLIVALVFFAVYCNTSDAIITSFATGFAADLIGSPMPMGPHMISFCICGTILAYLHRVVSIRRMPHQAMAIFAAGTIAAAMAHFLAYMLKGEPVSANIYGVILLTALYSCIIGPFLFMPSAWWMGFKTDRFRRR